VPAEEMNTINLPEKGQEATHHVRYTDLHCHILPGMDDGAADWDDAIAMAKNAVRSGAVRLVATPHVMRGVYSASPEDIKAKVAELNVRLQDSGVPLEVIPGSEIYLVSGTAREYRAGKLQAIGRSGYLLVELPALRLPDYARREIDRLLAAGAGVILAHPERNRDLCSSRDMLFELRESGVLFQVNAGSLIGVFGHEARDCAESLVKEGMAHFIGSDAHSGRPAAVTEVGADISAALRQVIRLSPSGPGFAALTEARVSRLLAGKL
jgi:protein-tyrosine phosphatase